MKRRRMVLALAGLAMCAGAVGTTFAVSTSEAGAVGSEVLAYGQQATTAPYTEFGVYSTGTGSSATGEFSVWQTHFPLTSSPFTWLTATVTCAKISGNTATITGKVVSGTHSEWVVAQMVGNSMSNKIRFSYAPTIHQVSTGCWAPSLAPVTIHNGDIRVGI